MSNQIDLGDPGKATVFSFNLPMPDSSGGYVVVINESPYGLRFSIPVGTGTLVFKVPSDSWRQVTINGRVIGSVQWSIANSVNTAVAPLSDVAVECYGLNECPNVSMGVISRQTNVGNSVPVGTQTTQVLNDGNSAPTVVAEGTPSGAVSSQLKWNNDGSGVFGGGKGSVNNAAIFTLPAGAVPVASIGAGALPAGVTVPAAQVGTGYPGADVSGAVASATTATTASSATTATTAAGLSGSIGASQVNPGAFPTGSFNMEAPNVVGSLALLLFSGAVTGGYGHAFQIENGNDNTCASTFGIGDFSQSPFGFGTWLYDQKNGAPVFTGVSSERTVAKRGPLAQMTTAGGGNAGNRMWEGTTDPGANAGEGDWWAPA